MRRTGDGRAEEYRDRKKRSRIDEKNRNGEEEEVDELEDALTGCSCVLPRASFAFPPRCWDRSFAYSGGRILRVWNVDTGD